jgi:dTDP-4-dehydrorhamnose reductase
VARRGNGFRAAGAAMRALITGGAGLLGGTLLATASAGVEVHATMRRTPVRGAPAHALDLADEDAVRALLRDVRPDVVIHTAYSTENPERNIVAATGCVARACAAVGAALIHVSTDLVHDGEHSPYADDAVPAPVELYGRAKAAAEAEVRAALPDAAIARTSLIVRADPPDAITARLVATLRSGGTASLYVDELRCPIAADDLARQLWEIAALPAAEARGAWNLVGPEAITRFALGTLIARRFGLDASLLRPARNADHPSPRPRDLRLLTGRADRTLRARARPITEVLIGTG